MGASSHEAWVLWAFFRRMLFHTPQNPKGNSQAHTVGGISALSPEGAYVWRLVAPWQGSAGSCSQTWYGKWCDVLSSWGCWPSSNGGLCHPLPTTCCPRLLIHMRGCQKESEMALVQHKAYKGDWGLGGRRTFPSLFPFEGHNFGTERRMWETPSILLEPRLWLMKPEDEPLERAGTHHPKTGTPCFLGAFIHLIKRMLNWNLRGRGKVFRRNIKPDMMRASIYKEFSKGATEKEMLRICHISVFQSTKYG